MRIRICPALSRAALILPVLAMFTLAAHADDTARLVTFIHHNDLHAHLSPHFDLVPDPARGPAATRIEMRGGLARTATLIKRIRKDNPVSVAMNIGDTFHGGVEALFTNGNAIVEPVNAIGFDVGVPGNWDFAYGPQVTRARFVPESQKLPVFRNDGDGMMSSMRRRLRDFIAGRGPSGERMAGMMPVSIKSPNYPNLAANLTFVRGELMPPTLMKTIGGVPVGFIGITSDIVPMMHKMLAAGMTFVEGEKAYRDLINRHAQALRKQGAHIVVVMSELGIQKDFRLANVVASGVDVFFSAHTHEATFKPLVGRSGALVVEAGNDGYVGRMDLEVRNGKVIGYRWKLMPVTADIPEDPEVKRLVDAARAPFLAKGVNMEGGMPFAVQKLDRPIDTVVGHSKISLYRTGSLQNPFNDFFTGALRRAAGTDLAMTPGFRFTVASPGEGYEFEDRHVASGDLTVEDLYRFFPVIYTLSTGRVKAASLRANIEALLTEVYSTDAFKQAGGWVSGFSGLDARVDLSRADGQRVLEMRRPGGAAIGARDTLTIAGCSRPLEGDDTLCSMKGFSDVESLDNPATGSAYTVVDFLTMALSKESPVTVAPKAFTDASGYQAWPVDPFVQPLKGLGK